MASFERTMTGRVFLISTPRVGSKLARTTSPRRAATTLFLVFQDGPGLCVAHVPLVEEVAFLLGLPRGSLGVVGAILLGHLAPLDRVEIRREDFGDDSASTRFRDQGVRAPHEVTREGHADDFIQA